MPRYCVTAPHKAIIAIRNDLAGGDIDGVTGISAPRPVQGEFAERPSHRQLELWELLVSFASGVASDAAYDALRVLLAKHPDVRHVHEADADAADSSDGDEGS
jgi:hypothetical protein